MTHKILFYFYYRQTFGTPMASPLSPIIADLTLQDLESKALASLSFTLPFYVRYVDDVALAAPSSMLKDILKIFNSFHPRLQFTMEEGVDNRLNYLDVTIIVNNGKLEFDWFHKSTFSGRYLSFESRHTLCQKRGTIFCLTDRVFLLSHPRFYRKNFELVIKIVLDNGYPLHYIFETINDRLKFLLARFRDKNSSASNIDNNKKEQVPISFFNIPYVPGISEQFSRAIRNLDTKISYTGFIKLNKFIKVHKDSLPIDLRTNVVYKISCNNCDASYVGQTRRFLKTRMKEHRNHINRKTTQRSVITDHRLLNHEFDWNSVEILDEEPILGKRLVFEMIHIKSQKNSINLHTDTDRLDHIYFPMIKNMLNI